LRETTKPGGLQRCPENPKESYPKGQKQCWEKFVQGADKKELCKAVGYTTPKLEGKAQVLVDEAGTKATSREERECMLIGAAFPRSPDAGQQTPLPDGGYAHQRVTEALVGRLLAKTRNTSAPGGDRMGAEIIKVMYECIGAHKH